MVRRSSVEELIAAQGVPGGGHLPAAKLAGCLEAALREAGAGEADIRRVAGGLSEEWALRAEGLDIDVGPGALGRLLDAAEERCGLRGRRAAGCDAPGEGDAPGTSQRAPRAEDQAAGEAAGRSQASASRAPEAKAPRPARSSEEELLAAQGVQPGGLLPKERLAPCLEAAMREAGVAEGQAGWVARSLSEEWHLRSEDEGVGLGALERLLRSAEERCGVEPGGLKRKAADDSGDDRAGKRHLGPAAKCGGARVERLFGSKWYVSVRLCVHLCRGPISVVFYMFLRGESRWPSLS